MCVMLQGVKADQGQVVLLILQDVIDGGSGVELLEVVKDVIDSLGKVPKSLRNVYVVLFLVGL